MKRKQGSLKEININNNYDMIAHKSAICPYATYCPLSFTRSGDNVAVPEEKIDNMYINSIAPTTTTFFFLLLKSRTVKHQNFTPLKYLKSRFLL